MTYNVKGLPWPAATGRSEALAEIGKRLAMMRREGRQPGVAVLQEAFTPEAKAIGDTAGYAWQVQGPHARAEPGNAMGGSWYLGETQAAILDSGLIVLSDYPVRAIVRAPFPAGACAGYDCLAAKGLLLVTVEVPGAGPVTIAATHLNSRKASGAPFARANAAYARQVAFAARTLAKRREPGAPLVLAGDLNRGDRPSRIAALDRAMRLAGGGRDALDGLASRSAPLDLAVIRRRGRDMQFTFAGTRIEARAVAAEIPFGTEADGSMLSDHMGYVVHYRLMPRVPRSPVRASRAA